MLFNVLALALLGFGFAVLVVTFLWVARLLAMRARERAARDEALPEGESAPVEAGAPEEEQRAEEEVQDETEARRVAGRAVIVGANLSLILGILACLLFRFSPLFTVLSVAGMYYGSRCQWTAFRLFRVFVLRALIGFGLSAASLGLHYLNLTGQIGALIPFLASP